MSGQRPMPPWFRREWEKARDAAPTPYTPPVLVEAEAPEVAA